MPDVDDRTRTVLRAAPRTPLAVRITVTGAPADPPSFRLEDGVCVVGAGRDSDLVIKDAMISRKHLEVRLVPEGIEVTDLESRNGTFYLGQRLQKMVLSPHTRVRVGSAELLFEAELSGAGVAIDADGYRGILGVSKPMRELFARLVRLEGSLVPVLIEGETGVGKELVAKAIREGSSLAARPFVVVNCGAFARELVQSELFGHKRGAFTGAQVDRRGAFEEADGGTLFLDEVGELPLDVQPTLLRALELGEVRPVGATQAFRVKVRVVAATNRDLEQEVEKGAFRRDLYHRLAVVRLRVPPLRERVDDVPVLARAFAAAEGAPELPATLLQDLAARAFSGNARELKNVVLAYLALGEVGEPGTSTSPSVDATLEALISLERPYAEQKDELVARFTTLYLARLLEAAQGNQTEAARAAGLDRGYLGKLLARHSPKR